MLGIEAVRGRVPVMGLTAQKEVKIEIGVDESDGREIRTDVFPLSSIRELVKKKL